MAGSRRSGSSARTKPTPPRVRSLTSRRLRDRCSESASATWSRPAAGKPKSKRSAMRLRQPRASNPPTPTEKVMTPDYPKPPFASHKQPMPGTTDAMQPRPDHGENTYKGCGRLKGIKAVITGGDSGISRAVATTFAREDAAILIPYLNAAEDAKDVKQHGETEG